MSCGCKPPPMNVVCCPPKRNPRCCPPQKPACPPPKPRCGPPPIPKPCSCQQILQWKRDQGGVMNASPTPSADEILYRDVTY